MKSLLVAIGLALALSVSAQTTTDEKEKQEPAQTETGNGKVDQKVQPGNAAQPKAPDKAYSNEREGARVNAQDKARTDARENGAVSHSTTVFRNGRETNERLDLHRGVREQTDVHFQIGTHPRDWWLRTYSIVLIDGCHYFLADNGCWYPAYGFDPSCDFPAGVVYCD